MLFPPPLYIYSHLHTFSSLISLSLSLSSSLKKQTQADMEAETETNSGPRTYPAKGYALSGKIMLSAIVILFLVVVLMVCLHIYARWYLLRARRRQIRRRRRTHLVFYTDPTAATAASGLDAALLNSLPVFSYSSDTYPATLECAVCLSDFEENEKIRLLPKCNHSFHIDCINMWFHSHSTCPLCRTPVDGEIPVLTPDNNPIQVVISGGGEPVSAEPSPSTGLCSACRNDEDPAGTSSVEPRRKRLEMVGVSIEVPRRNESVDESVQSSPASQAFRSLRRILSMDWKAQSPSSGPSCSYSTGLDEERGVEETRPSQAQTPR